MAILEILTYPDSFLRKSAKPVENIDDEIQQIIDDMAETMYDAPGVGLASIQIGCDKSIIVYDIMIEEKRKLNVLINPVIVASEGKVVTEEGCLSVPELKADVKRAEIIQVEGLDRHGNPVRFEAADIHAIVLQHEIDHLNGKLFIDHISSLKRGLYKKKVKKQMKQE